MEKLFILKAGWKNRDLNGFLRTQKCGVSVHVVYERLRMTNASNILRTLKNAQACINHQIFGGKKDEMWKLKAKNSKMCLGAWKSCSSVQNFPSLQTSQSFFFSSPSLCPSLSFQRRPAVCSRRGGHHLVYMAWRVMWDCGNASICSGLLCSKDSIKK